MGEPRPPPPPPMPPPPAGSSPPLGGGSPAAEKAATSPQGVLDLLSASVFSGHWRDLESGAPIRVKGVLVKKDGSRRKSLVKAMLGKAKASWSERHFFLDVAQGQLRYYYDGDMKRLAGVVQLVPFQSSARPVGGAPDFELEVLHTVDEGGAAREGAFLARALSEGARGEWLASVRRSVKEISVRFAAEERAKAAKVLEEAAAEDAAAAAMLDAMDDDGGGGSATGSIKLPSPGEVERRERARVAPGSPKTCEKDFEPLRVVGRGASGAVLLVRKKGTTSSYFAMKVMSKRAIQESKAERNALVEREVLLRVRHPFLVNLRYSFQSRTKLYLVTDYYGGEIHGAHGLTARVAKSHLMSSMMMRRALQGRGVLRGSLRRASGQPAEMRTVKYLALANVAAVGCLGAAVALRPEEDPSSPSDGDDVQKVIARFEALGRAVRLGTTLVRVAVDYKRAEFGSDGGASSALEAAEAALRDAQDLQEKSGLRVERARSAGERRRGLEDAAAARAAVLAASEAVAAAQPEDGGGGSAVHARNAERLLELARANRGVYLKIAQHCAQLDYLLPKEYTAAFARCLDDAPTSSWEDVRRVVREELGGEPEEIFTTFEQKPLASASLAQVHRATWRGRAVAVKVQHRGLAETSRGDLDACALAVSIMGRVFPDFKLGWLVDEIAPHLPKELDFRHEAENCARARKIFERWADVTVPETFPEVSGGRVLTMSFEEGVNGTAREAIEADLGLDARRTARLVTRAFAEMTFSGGHVHCDPHAANVLVRRGPGGAPHLVILDHGLYRDLDLPFRLEYARLWRALTLADTAAIKASSHELGVGPLYPLFAAMLTQRPWDDVANPDMNSLRSNGAADNAMLRGYAERYAKEITLVLDRVPRQMLLLLKMSDCLRHLDRALGGSNNTHVLTAHACADALFAHDRDLKAYLAIKLRLWAHDALEACRGRRNYDPVAAARAKVHVPDKTSGFAKDSRGHLWGRPLVK